MNKEELIEILRQFDEKRVEELPEKTRNIFYAIMKIADERDELENIRKKAIEYIKNKLTIGSILDGKKNYCLNSYSFDYEDLLNILNKGDNKDVKKNNTHSN